MLWRNRNELKQDNYSHEGRCKEVEGDILSTIKKYEPYLDMDYEELQYFKFVQSDDEEVNAEFSIINPNLLYLFLQGRNRGSNAYIVSAVIDDSSLELIHNEQFYEISSQLNLGQQYLFNFIMQYALYCKLAEKNNELPSKPFQKFLIGDAGVGKSSLIKT